MIKERRHEIILSAVIFSFLLLLSLVATIGGGLRAPEEKSEIMIVNIDISAEAIDLANAMLNITTYLDNLFFGRSGSDGEGII